MYQSNGQGSNLACKSIFLDSPGFSIWMQFSSWEISQLLLQSLGPNGSHGLTPFSGLARVIPLTSVSSSTPGSARSGPGSKEATSVGTTAQDDHDKMFPAVAGHTPCPDLNVRGSWEKFILVTEK